MHSGLRNVELVETIDWGETPLGPRGLWPQSLKTTVDLVLSCETPMTLLWGVDGILIYNDAYVDILGPRKHPEAMGQSARRIFPEVWSTIGPLLESVRRTGQGTRFPELLFFLERDGFLEENYFDFSYNPVRDESGEVVAVLDVVVETTQRVVAERQLRTLRELGEVEALDEVGTCLAVTEALDRNRYDVPFALLALYEGEALTLAARCGPEGVDLEGFGTELLLEVSALLASDASEPLRLNNLAHRLTVQGFPQSDFGIPEQAVLLPLRSAGALHGVVILGASPRRRDNGDYRQFFELIASSLTASLSRAVAAREEQRRLQALQALDRAKTDFFFNVSHEFRTPLTLMLGPLRVLLDQESLLASTRREIEMVERNAGRLMKLVNNLLDVSKLEARKLTAVLEPVDLAALTADIASVFRSTIERGGLTFSIECPPLAHSYQIDPDMWEKIVSNLLSNAFKFTLEGEIRLSLREDDEGAVLTICDSGSGIAADDLPHLFDRFHRTQTTLARSHEGAGIGLSLVEELSLLLGATVTVQSEPDRGSLFSVHLPPSLRTELLPQGPRRASPAVLGSLTEMLPEEQGEAAPPISEEKFGNLLVVDDNADMREFARRALAPYYEVRLARDGLEALELIEGEMPELIVSDIMMPRCDGLQMLRQLRENEATRALPVLLISARAGEGSQAVGLESGADDYLVKPFSRRQLQSRVRSLLERSRELRLEARREQETARIFSQLAQATLAVGKAQDIGELLTLTAEQAGLLVEADQACCQLQGEAALFQELDPWELALQGEDGQTLAVLRLVGVDPRRRSGTRQAMLSQLTQLSAAVLERLTPGPG